MTPTFSASTKVYTASTTNASDTISATAAAGVEIMLFVNGVQQALGSATWAVGQNTVTLTTYYDGFARETYVVTVTKT